MKKVIKCARLELRKTLFAGKGLLIIAVCLAAHILICLTARTKDYDLSFDRNVYKNYAEQFGGEYSENVQSGINAELERQTELFNAPISEDISSEEYTRLLLQKEIAGEKLKTLKAISKKYEELAGLKDYGAALVYDLEFSEYTKRFGWEWAGLVCITLLSVSVVFIDKRAGMNSLLFPSKLGKNTLIKGKTFTVCLTALVSSLVFSGAQTLIFTCRWELGDISAPIQSFSGFESCGAGISAGNALLLGCVIKATASAVLAMTLVVIGALFKNEVISVCGTAIIVAAGFLFAPRGWSAAFALPVCLSGTAALSGLNTAQVVFIPLIHCLLTAVLSLAAVIISRV